ncbi:hypothetical protein PanWU01x14_160080 [Parasponia andersonii]|uniref:Uncharacterized protein n=1 Tax=Parasponia andersonii TaxID=3476 RepID=A0A2P5CDX8_PARAD|nr:hypothetical protein PanWU01x14_160080 [Parasponia andersonii]
MMIPTINFAQHMSGAKQEQKPHYYYHAHNNMLKRKEYTLIKVKLWNGQYVVCLTQSIKKKKKKGNFFFIKNRILSLKESRNWNRIMEELSQFSGVLVKIYDI